MPKHNPDNERIKRRYFVFLREAKRQSEDSVDAVAKALTRFEESTRHRDFRSFHFEQAVAFKRRLADFNSVTSGEKLSKATQYSTLSHLKRFFQWLAMQPGYKSTVTYPDAEYFNLSSNDSRVATARRVRPVPTLDQIKHVIRTMPAESVIDRRNRALIAFALLTGARDSALATMRLKHVDVAAGSVYQDARDVRTKFSKSFTTHFFPVGDEFEEIVRDWITYLGGSLLWGNEEPLFPASLVTLDANKQFATTGVARKGWATASPIRSIFRDAFSAAGLPYYNPHSFRHTLVQLGESICRTPEEFKAWSQNLGHDGVLTTFSSYGCVSPRRQGELIRNMARGESPPPADMGVLLQRFATFINAELRGDVKPG